MAEYPVGDISEQLVDPAAFKVAGMLYIGRGEEAEKGGYKYKGYNEQPQDINTGNKTKFLEQGAALGKRIPQNLSQQ